MHVRFLEWFLVLFALYQSGIIYLGCYLCAGRGLLNLTYSDRVSDWVYYYVRTAGALGILGYILFRNSRCCTRRAAQRMESAKTMSEPEGPQVSRRDSRRVCVFESCLVQFVAFAGGILGSLDIFAGHRTIPVGTPGPSLAGQADEMLCMAASLGLLSYVLGRTSRGVQDLGLRWTSRDVAVALPLALGSVLAFRLAFPMALGVAEMAAGRPAQLPDIGNYLIGTSVSMATVLDQVVNGVFEELIVRGYLMTEVRRITGSMIFAILCSVAVQCSYHLYQGGPRAFAHIGGFMVFACYYAKTNRLLPPVLAHIAMDLAAVVTHALRPS